MLSGERASYSTSCLVTRESTIRRGGGQQDGQFVRAKRLTFTPNALRFCTADVRLSRNCTQGKRSKGTTSACFRPQLRRPTLERPSILPFFGAVQIDNFHGPPCFIRCAGLASHFC